MSAVLNPGKVEISFAKAIEISMKHANQSLPINGLSVVTPGMLAVCFGDLTHQRLSDVLLPSHPSVGFFVDEKYVVQR